jgi:hypothetical protein
VGPSAGVDGCGKSRPPLHQVSIPGPSGPQRFPSPTDLSRPTPADILYGGQLIESRLTPCRDAYFRLRASKGFMWPAAINLNFVSGNANVQFLCQVINPRWRIGEWRQALYNL